VNLLVCYLNKLQNGRCNGKDKLIYIGSFVFKYFFILQTFVICVQIFVPCLTETQCSVSYPVHYIVMLHMLDHFQLDYVIIIIIIIIIIIGTTAPFEPRPSSEASASCPYSLQHSSNFSPATSWHLPSHLLSILVSACL